MRIAVSPLTSQRYADRIHRVRLPNLPHTPAASISHLHHPLIRHRLLPQIILALGLSFAPAASLPADPPQPTVITVEGVAALLEQARFDTAAPMLADLAGNDNDQAQFLRGLTLLTGAGVELDWESGIAALRQAAAKGNRTAAVFLLNLEANRAERHDVEAWTTTSNNASAITTPTPSTLGFVDNRGRAELNYVDSEYWNRKQAAQGNPTACFNLSRFYKVGIFGDPNFAEYRRWLARAGTAGHAKSLEEAAVNALLGLYGEREDRAQAEALTMKAAEAGSVDSQYTVAKFILDGDTSLGNDTADAVRWLERATSGKNAEAMIKLADLLRDGDRVPGDDRRAVALYEQAAALGAANARSNLGWMYANGRGVDADPARAAALYREAADGGDVWAMRVLGLAYRDGKGVPVDYALAREWLARAVEKTDAPAMRFLGWMHAEGRGGPIDQSTAFEWFDRAAQAGDADAQNTLGWYLLNGIGTQRDKAEAVAWFELAAEQGNTVAMWNLADIARGCYGGRIDRAGIRRWFKALAPRWGAAERVAGLEWTVTHEYDETLARPALAELERLAHAPEGENTTLARSALAKARLWAMLPSLRCRTTGTRLARELRRSGVIDGTLILLRAFVTNTADTAPEPGEIDELANSIQTSAVASEFRRQALEIWRDQPEPSSLRQAEQLLQFARDHGERAAAADLAELRELLARVPAEPDEQEVARRVAATPPTGENQPPAPVVSPQPHYPDVLRQDGVSGSVVIGADVTPEGRLANLEVIRSTHELLAVAALEAAARWRFLPPHPTVGRLVSSRVELPFDFKPDQGNTDGSSISAPTVTQAAEPCPAWMTDYAEATAAARKQQRPMLLLFTGSDWCPPCKRLERSIMDTNFFAQFARENLVLVLLDFPKRKQLAPELRKQNEALAERFGVHAYPTVLLLTPEGEPLGKLGYAEGGPKAYTRAINRIISRQN